MRILILTQYFPPDFGGNAMLMAHLSQDLVKANHKVDVVTSMPHYPFGEIPPSYGFRLMRHENSNGTRVTRWLLYATPKKTFWRRMLSYSSFASVSLLAGLAARKPDVAFVYTPPLHLAAAAAAACRIRNVPLVVNVQDIYPDAAVNLGIISRQSMTARVAGSIEKAVYGAASRITVIGSSFISNLTAKGVDASKITVVPNWTDTELIKPLPPDNPFSRDNGLAGRFVVSYSGNLGFTSGVESVLECARLARKHNDIMFLFVGEGVLKKRLQDRAASLNLKNVLFLPYQLPEVFPLVLASSDVCLVTMSATAHASSIPGKAYTTMAAGKPIVAAVDESSEIAQQIRECGCGVVVPPESPGQMLEAILKMKSRRAEATAMGLKGLETVREKFSRTVLTARYENLLREVAAESVST
jgi:colanic acid biosynthesis glycosyl transferase WcaI